MKPTQNVSIAQSVTKFDVKVVNLKLHKEYLRFWFEIKKTSLKKTLLIFKTNLSGLKKNGQSPWKLRKLKGNIPFYDVLLIKVENIGQKLENLRKINPNVCIVS